MAAFKTSGESSVTGMTTRLAFTSTDSLAVFEAIGRPVWAFELDAHRICWANAAALRFWRAETLESLVRREFSDDGVAVGVRLRTIMEQTPPGQSAQETWTLYPLGEPKQMSVNLTPVTVGEDARDALLIEVMASDAPMLAADERRLVEAVRYTSTMISYFRLDGAIVSMNPSAT